MINSKNKEKQLKDEKWLYYQDVKVLKTKVKPTEENEKKIKGFRKFIDKKEEDTKKEN